MKYIGIDVSKHKLDMALINAGGQVLDQVVVSNRSKAITARLERWKRERELSEVDCLACFEPTGHYSDEVMRTLVGAQVPTWRAHPLEIKQRMGMVRGKNDKVDALRIADFAMRHQDKKRVVGPDTLAVLDLKQLLSFRQRLMVDARRHSVYVSDLYPAMNDELHKTFGTYSKGHIKRLRTMVGKVDGQIKKLILADPIMRGQYELLLSVEYVGPVLAAHLLAATERFTRMKEARQLACHAGVAPHDHSSGSSSHGRPRVSHQADKTLKSLLHMASLGATRSKGDLGIYYRRKVAEGKNSMSVLNAVRNKIIHRVCAVIKRGTPYEMKDQAPL